MNYTDYTNVFGDELNKNYTNQEVRASCTPVSLYLCVEKNYTNENLVNSFFSVPPC